jgi:hypothetical protein
VPCQQNLLKKILDLFGEPHLCTTVFILIFNFFSPIFFGGLKNLVIFFQKKTKVSQIHTLGKNKIK